MDEVARSLIPKEAYGAAGMKAALHKTGIGEPRNSNAGEIQLTVNGTARGSVTAPAGQTVGQFLRYQAQRWGVRSFSAYADGRKLDTADDAEPLNSISEIEIVAKDARGSVASPSSPRSLPEALLHVIEVRDKKINDLERKLRDAIGREAAAKGKSDVRVIHGVKVLTTRLDNLDRTQMREMADKFRTEIGSGVVVLGSASNGNVSLIVGVTKDLTSRIQAGKVIGPVAEKVGGKGGGRPDLAEAGGRDAAALDSALAAVYNVVESLLG